MARKGNTPPKAPAGDYAVGYGRPPVRSRFKPGQSGNPKGRPAGAVDLSSHIEAALNEKVAITEGGRRRTITKGKAIAKQLVNKAAGGDLRAARLLLPQRKLARGDVRQATPDGGNEAPLPPPQIDLSTLTTAEMEKVYEAALILEGKTRDRPAPLIPPSDPEDASPEED